MKVTLIAAGASLLFGAAAGWGLTHGYYKGVLADKDLAISQAQQRATATALFAQTQSQLALSQIDQTYQDKLHEQDALHARDLAAVRTGALRLRDRAAKCPVEVQSGASTGSGDGEAGAELSVAATEFLLGEADRADRLVHQLDACQAVVEADRKAVEQLFPKDPE
jgi:hypothetical protein